MLFIYYHLEKYSSSICRLVGAIFLRERCEIMKISQNGLNQVKRFEGRRLTAYKPVAAVRVEQEDDAMVERAKLSQMVKKCQ